MAYENFGGLGHDKINFDALKKIGMAILIVAIVVIALILLVTIFFKFKPTEAEKAASVVATETFSIADGVNNLLTTSTDTPINKLKNHVGHGIYYFFRFGLGMNLEANHLPDSSIIILIATFFLFFVVLKDLVDVFGMFNKTTSILVGLLITIIIANLGLFISIFALLTKAFAFAAGFSLILVMVSTFGAAFVAHTGLTYFGYWMMQRKAMLAAAKTEAGGYELAGVVRGFKEIGRALKG